MTVAERLDPPRPDRTRGRRADLVAATFAAALVALASVLGWVLVDRGVPILVDFPPLLAEWAPHLGPGSAAAVVVAVAVVAWGPSFAASRSWGRVLGVTWLAAVAWTMSLALVDGVERGFSGRLTTLTEYLHEVPRITDVPAFLERFASLIPSGQPGFWTTHVAGHPPLATLVFVGLDRVGLGGGVAASSLVVLVGSSAAVAVAVTLRALGAEDLARRFLPFGVLFPGAVWVGVSADGMFAAVFAWGVALVALAAARDRAGDRLGGAALGLAAGVVLGGSLFLNYGLSVAMLVPVAVLAAARSWRPAVPAVVGAGAVTATFAGFGFWWFDGYHALLVRYVQPGEFGGLRPYSYFVWANLASLVLVVGLATVAGLRRVAADRPRRVTTSDSGAGGWTGAGTGSGAGAGAWTALAALVGATLVAVALADLSGMSKAEVERIWLPFAVWLLPATALLPRARVRGWLAAQAVLTLAINHLLLTVW